MTTQREINVVICAVPYCKLQSVRYDDYFMMTTLFELIISYVCSYLHPPPFAARHTLRLTLTVMLGCFHLRWTVFSPYHWALLSASL